MANIPVNPTASYTVAADDLGGGVAVEYVKLDAGAPGAASPVNNTRPLPVSVAQSSATPLWVTGTVQAGAGTTVVSISGVAAVTTQPAMAATAVPGGGYANEIKYRQMAMPGAGYLNDTATLSGDNYVLKILGSIVIQMTLPVPVVA